MSRIVGKKTIKLELEDGQYIEMREKIPYREMQNIAINLDRENDANNLKMALPLLELAVVGWHLVDEDGAAFPFSKEAIGNSLDLETATMLLEKAFELYMPDKKKLDKSPA